jgi:hypothetical protein
MSTLAQLLDCPLLEIQWRTEWSATNSEAIRDALAQRLREKGVSFTDQNLKSSPPAIDHHSVSISHCPKGGGFALAPHPFRVGYDLEVTSRLTTKIVERISFPEELSAAPDPANLFPAKEAVFKSLWKIGQPLTINQIRIVDWREDYCEGQKVWVFKAQTATNNATPSVFTDLAGRGLIVTHYEIKESIFALNFGPE